MERIKTLIDKEWAEAFKNKMVLGTLIFMPILFMILPLFQLALMRNIPASELNDMPAAILAVCQAQNFTRRVVLAVEDAVGAQLERLVEPPRVGS